MNRPESRPLLPQTAPMSNFSFAPPNMGFGDTKKNYVFVDEHNRHKRLKVMRACEGCRRRKIKCDAATTNSWPCAACVRLKLQCVPPTVNYNRSQMGSSQVSGLERVLDFADSSGDSGDEGYMPSRPMMQNVYQSHDILASPSSYTSGMVAFNPSTYGVKQDNQMPYSNLTSAPMQGPEPPFHGQASFHHHQASSTGSIPGIERSDSWSHEDVSAETLSEVLGELKIDERGMAPYIYQQKKTLAEAPALEEIEYALPAPAPSTGATVRIPPELMPDEDQALQYLDIFFTHIHPYVPVISKSYFYQQWHTNRASISPLLLEAIFACAGRMSDDPAQGAQWLALASKHETCFMDVPRLSTIQALLILLKAREANPKRGYYYRSWMTLKTVCTMAQDLELDEHLSSHQNGRACSDPVECLVKTRIWQTIYVCEIMVGGPQGRRDMATDPDTIDFNPPQNLPGLDAEEYQVSHDFVYFVRAIRNVRTMSDTYVKVKKEKDWNSHPMITSLNPLFPRWLDELPVDLQIHYPADGSPPWLPSHFAANIHCYYHLSILILHRPQLMASSFGTSGTWKEHMAMSYASARSLCRIQEAINNQFGINGFLYMQRGINFAIYCILTCTLLHLAAITSPDHDFNTDAKEYFTRHMRILENCISAWPMPDMQAQIQSLREAFSADINKPFALKPSFPFGSPISRLAPSPPSDTHYSDIQLVPRGSQEPPSHIRFHSNPITPPISAGHEDSKDALASSSLSMMTSEQRSQTLPSHLGEENLAWNPTRLFDQWNTAFGTPPSTASVQGSMNAQQSPTMYSAASSTVGSHDISQVHDALQQQRHYQTPPITTPVSQQPSYTAAPNPYVTPSMWQDTVASTYVPNDLKRRWDGAGGPAWVGSNDQQQVKRPR